MEKFKGKYRIESTRLQTWDYSWQGSYFITICTQDSMHYFGEIVNQKMRLSHVGVLADVLWYEIKNHTKNVELGEFVVMPNHIHGILTLKGDDIVDRNDNRNHNCRDKACLVSTPTTNNNLQNNDRTPPPINQTIGPRR